MLLSYGWAVRQRGKLGPLLEIFARSRFRFGGCLLDALILQATQSAKSVSVSAQQGLAVVESIDALIVRVHRDLDLVVAEAEGVIGSARREIAVGRDALGKGVQQVSGKLDEADKVLQGLQARCSEDFQGVIASWDSLRKESVRSLEDVGQQSKSFLAEVDTVLTRVEVMRSELDDILRSSTKLASSVVQQFELLAGKQLGSLSVGLVDAVGGLIAKLEKAHSGLQNNVLGTQKNIQGGLQQFSEHVDKQIATANQGVGLVLGETGALSEIRKQAESLASILEAVASKVGQARRFTDENVAIPIRKINEGITNLQPIIKVLKFLKDLGIL